MNNFAQELQNAIDQANALEAMSVAERAVDIFTKEVKKELLSQAKRGVEIDDMKYIVSGVSFDNIYYAFRQANKAPCNPNEKQYEKFQALLVSRMQKEGLKFEFQRQDTPRMVIMKFTVFANDI